MTPALEVSDVEQIENSVRVETPNTPAQTHFGFIHWKLHVTRFERRTGFLSFCNCFLWTESSVASYRFQQNLLPSSVFTELMKLNCVVQISLQLSLHVCWSVISRSCWSCDCLPAHTDHLFNTESWRTFRPDEGLSGWNVLAWTEQGVLIHYPSDLLTSTWILKLRSTRQTHFTLHAFCFLIDIRFLMLH